ncbi:MAG: ABC transporter ATP-binding protein [Gemmatimonadaceae bacterium]|nr:ABC transporter ATP-binding protein [Gemmatimonadaceae bacterium]
MSTGATPRHAATPATIAQGPAVRMTGIVKRFGAVTANIDASLVVTPGEIHAVVGENGAGKSTLLRVLSGMFAPDAGTVELFGRDVTGWSTAQAIAAGVGMVHQHFMLVPTLSVAENVVLGIEPVRGLRFDRDAAERRLATLARECGLACEPGRLVRDLSVGEAQRVEILKTLYRGAKLLILDEPTAVLSPPEVDELWRVLRTLRAGGATIVLVTHKLDELMDVTDHITVMRAGRTVGALVTARTTPAAIATAMVGRAVQLDASGLPVGAAASHDTTGTPSRVSTQAFTGPAVGTPTPAYADTPRLALHDLVVAGPRRARAVDGVTLAVAPGEVLGIAGVEGNGQTELVEAIAGLREVLGGRVLVDGTDVTRFSVGKRLRHGITHIPEDRHARGLVLDYSIADNLILGRQRHYARSGRIDRTRVRRFAEERIAAFDIRPADPDLPARALSGGNQQKVVVAREMPADFRVLVASQPTRGVDVGAIEFIHDQLRAARRAGKAILLVSAELNEILALSDRIAVMYGGRVVHEVARAHATAESLGPYMTGAAA